MLFLEYPNPNTLKVLASQRQHETAFYAFFRANKTTKDYSGGCVVYPEACSLGYLKLKNSILDEIGYDPVDGHSLFNHMKT